MADYSGRVFPLATKSFSCYHRNTVTTIGNNIVPISPFSQQPYAIHLSIALKDIDDVVMTDAHGAGYYMTGRFLGATFTDQTIGLQLGDIIADETENDILGKPVRYEIDGISFNVVSCKLHLDRLDVGV